MVPCGVDLGNHSVVLATAGRSGTEVLANQLSNLETPSLLVFGRGGGDGSGDRRYVGEEAATQRLRHADGTATGCRALLGQAAGPTLRANGPAADWRSVGLKPTSRGGLALYPRAHYESEQEEEGGGQGKEEAVPVEAALAGLLASCAAACLADRTAQAGGALAAAFVLAAPAWAGVGHRLALSNAALIAGLGGQLLPGGSGAGSGAGHVEVMSEVGACALFYAAERLAGLAREQHASGFLGPSDEVVLDSDTSGPADSGVEVPGNDCRADGAPTQSCGATVLFVDVGHAGTTAALVRFGSPTAIDVLDVRAVAVGGSEIDSLVADHFVNLARESPPSVDLSAEAGRASARVRKARQRLLLAAEQTKKVLSVNESDTQLLEEIAQGVDLRCVVRRPEFEAELERHCVLERIADPVDAILRSQYAHEITALELYGGTARVPSVQRAVTAAMQRHGCVAPLRRSLNGVDAIARGCALRAAMSLPTFNRKRAVVISDASPWSRLTLLLHAPSPTLSGVPKGEAGRLLAKSRSGEACSAAQIAQPPQPPPPRPVVTRPVLELQQGAALPSALELSASAHLRLGDVVSGLVILELLAPGNHGEPLAAAGNGLESMAHFTIEVVEPLSDDEASLMTGEYAFVLSADCLGVCVHRRGASPSQQPVLRAVRQPGASTSPADWGTDELEALQDAQRRIAEVERQVAAAEAARDELERTVYRLREELLQARSDGRVVADDSRVSAAESALARCEDWLYEEETYAIVEPSSFQDALTELQTQVRAALPKDDGGFST
jgi:molecular chaperone DnaK (HSP70)